MEADRYAAGVALLALVVIPPALAARALRRRVLPGWRGAPALLAEVVLALSIVLLVAEVLGVVHALDAVPLALACAAVGLGVRLGVSEHLGAAPGEGTTRDRATAPVLIAAGVAVASVAILWASATVASLDRGPVNLDSIWYHLPFAAHFAQSGSVTSLPHIEAVPMSVSHVARFVLIGPTGVPTLYPVNSSVLHAIGMIAFGRDFLTPLINLLFMGLALLAGWCIGRPSGARAAAAAMAGVAAVVAVPTMAGTQAGEGTNDIVGLAFFLAAAALVVTTPTSRATIAVGGLAAGLAAGTKLSFVLPVAALTVGVVATARSPRARVLLAWLGPLCLTGGYWYLRNLISTGSPLPFVRLGIGPLAFPRAHFPSVDHWGESLLDHAFDLSLWRDRFFPDLHSQFGFAWPLLLALAAAGLVAALARGRPAGERMLGSVGVVALAAYVVTPETAGGPHGELFAYALRYLTPALALGLALLSGATVLRSPRRALLTAGLLSALAIVTVVATSPWPASGTRTAVAAVAVALVAAIVFARRAVGPRRRVIATAGALLVVVIAGWPVERHYLAKRYAIAGGYTHVAPGPGALYAWARDQHDARISIEGFLTQYPLYGTDLSNRVTYVGRPGPHGEFHPARSCSEWRSMLAEQRADYVVTTPLDFTNGGNAPAPPEAAWTRTIPGATAVASFPGGGTAFRLSRPPAAGRC